MKLKCRYFVSLIFISYYYVIIAYCFLRLKSLEKEIF